MDLHTGEPIWLARRDSSEVAFPPLQNDVRCAIAIVGGGITGALLAYRLTALNSDVVMVDARQPGLGSTAASTSLLLAETDAHLFELEQRFGAAAAARVYQLGYEALETIGRIAQESSPRSEFARRPSLYLASSMSDVPRIEAEYVARARGGFPVEKLSGLDLRRLGYSADAPLALRDPRAGQIDAYRFTRDLVDVAVSRGMRCFGETRVAIDSKGSPPRLATPHGKHIIADAVVLATGYEAHEQLPLVEASLSSTWVLASEPAGPLPGWPDEALIWETARPYVYLRRTHDGRVLMGGLDEPYESAHQDHARICAKAAGLLARFERIFPDAQLSPSRAWAGAFGASADGLPYVGRPDPETPVYYALGYGGNGITFGAIAAEIVAADLRGRAHPDAQLFAFNRAGRDTTARI